MVLALVQAYVLVHAHALAVILGLVRAQELSSSSSLPLGCCVGWGCLLLLDLELEGLRRLLTGVGGLRFTLGRLSRLEFALAASGLTSSTVWALATTARAGRPTPQSSEDRGTSPLWWVSSRSGPEQLVPRHNLLHIRPV